MRAVVGVVLGVAFFATSADAVNCSQWNRMNAYQKADAIDGMIARALRSNEARQYNVDVAAIGRCLESEVVRMQQDFDSLCSDSRTAGMQAIRGAFKNYIWSCVR